MTRVKLNSFRIQNYRSIKDSGWKSLAIDNITVLIGQNESGKTTVLEALQSFYSGEIIDDILRGDQTMPVVSCKFTIENNGLLIDFIDVKKIPPALLEKIKEQSYFVLTRIWNEDKSSKVLVTEDKIFEYYQKLDDNEKKLDRNITEQIEKIIHNSEKAFEDFDLLEQEKNEEQKLLSDKRKVLELNTKILRKAKKTDQKIIAETENKQLQKDYENQEKLFTKKVEEYENLKVEASSFSKQLKICEGFQQLTNELDRLTKELNEKQLKVLDYRHLKEISSRYKDQKKNKFKLDLAIKDLSSHLKKLEIAKEERHLQLLITNKVINEKLHIKSATQQAKKEIVEKKKFYTLNSLGGVLLSKVPVFEFFEDFSGLLPNKIDLEDILNENEHIEGYKAAKNFLTLAGLDASFFREKNQRILKQRIALLNSDVTINFQDYWSQQVGNNSKIKLHFELEHYDYTVPEKRGKPYIEFWIKDKQERLYPKQRSRGVRWFLSFYLELKATEAQSAGNRILLIDEPGLCLHARAQEDVLKVFEDLKDSMQIIYCTHSPHLVKTDKLYRVLAVQRANEEDDRSQSVIFESNVLNEASADTLTPVYSLMGIRLGDQQFFKNTKNLILPDTASYYYMECIAKMIPEASKINFIPSTNENTLPLLINIMSGWQIDYGVLLFGTAHKKLADSVKETTLLNGQDNNYEKLIHLSNLDLIEDVFSTIDFKKYVLLKREGITDTNSEYIITNGLSRKILATNFVNYCNDNNVILDDFDETTKTNITNLFKKLQNLFKS